MTTEDSAAAAEQAAVTYLVREAAITEAEARSLVDMLGINRASLVREARIMKKNR